MIKHIITAIKGMCMGAADVIPGVSGGTIAFMTGIYETLIDSINSINGHALKLLYTGKFKELWKHINGSFLLSLFIGILISVLSLAKAMQYLLENHPTQTWSFFFGLIVASSIIILKGIKGWKIKDIITLILGIGLGVLICTLSPTQTPDDLWFIFISGAIAICAMILPGISGSFILLILGKYEYIMAAISDMNLAVLAVFAVGAVVGILSFSKFLHWLMKRYNRLTILTLAGFIIGSLIKVWPWKGINDLPCLPTPEASSHICSAILFALLGFALVTSIELISKLLSKRDSLHKV